MNFAGAAICSQNSLELMFHKILVAMDTSTIGKSVFDELLPWQGDRIQSHAATRSVP